MPYQGAIFDVDGVLVDSPHELAWREALKELMEGDWHDIRDQTSWTAERFTTQVYQQVMAGKPRLAGARAALEYFGVPDVDRRIEQYAAAKQEHVVQLIEQGRFMAFPDALRFILAVKDSGFRVAAASSSKNAKLFLERIRLDTFAAEQRLDYGFVHDGMTLEELFDADISGRDFPRGKPDPMIFLTAAEELGLSPDVCFVVEDATSGVQAAKAGGMAAIGVARLGDEQQLTDAGADLVVTTLDDISLPTLIEGRLEERQAAEEIRRRYTERPPDVWTLVYDGYDPERQGLREALCALGNGYFVTRGALSEAKADDANYPGTYVAGLYNRLVSEVAGRQVENEDLVNVPNWLPLQFRISDGPWFDMQQPGVEDHRLELDGLLTKIDSALVSIVWREETDGVVTPVVGQPAIDQMSVIDELMHRQQFNRCDPKRGEVLDDHRMADGSVASAHVIRDARMSHRETLHVHLIDDGFVVLVLGWSIMAPVEIRRGDHGQHVVAERIKIVQLGWFGETVGEQGFVAVDLTTDGFRVRIQQELGRVAPMPPSRLVRPIDPVAVELPRLDSWDVDVPDVAIHLDQIDARLGPVIVDQAKLNFRRHFGEEREVHAGAIERRA